MDAKRWAIHQRTGVSIPPDVFASILGEQRARFLETFGAFDDDRWSQPSRCGDWDAHTVFRHLTDAAEMQAAGFTGEPPAFAKPMSDFDPQTTPDEWLAHSANETPAETLTRYGRASLVACEAASAAFAAGNDRESGGPYGPAHWSVVTVHVLWDAWIHERDILLADGGEPIGVSGSVAEQRLTTMYGALMTAVPGVKFGMPLAATMTLDHGDAPLFHLDVHGDAGELAVVEVGELDAPDLRGDLLAFADSLGGRGEPLVDVLTGPADLVGGMAILGQAI